MKLVVGMVLGWWMLGCTGLTTPSTPTQAPASKESSKKCLKDAWVEYAIPPDLEPIGSFAKTRATEDHVYGFAIDLFRDRGQCVGILSVWNGGLEPQRAAIHPSECDKELQFEVDRLWWIGFDDPGPFPATLAFSGILNEGHLTGALVNATERQPIDVDGEPPHSMRWEENARLTAADSCVGPATREH